MGVAIRQLMPSGMKHGMKKGLKKGFHRGRDRGPMEEKKCYACGKPITECSCERDS